MNFSLTEIATMAVSILSGVGTFFALYRRERRRDRVVDGQEVRKNGEERRQDEAVTVKELNRIINMREKRHNEDVAEITKRHGEDIARLERQIQNNLVQLEAAKTDFGVMAERERDCQIKNATLVVEMGNQKEEIEFLRNDNVKLELKVDALTKENVELRGDLHALREELRGNGTIPRSGVFNQLPPAKS